MNLELSNRQLKLTLFGTLMLVLSSGCSTPYNASAIVAPKIDTQWNEPYKKTPYSAFNVSSHWWKDFNDPVLTTLVERAYNENLSLRIAALRILKARTELNVAKSGMFPSVNAKNSVIRTQPSGNAQRSNKRITNYQISLDSAWELDIWGRVRQNIKLAKANLHHLDEAYQDAALSLGAEVASNYIRYRVLQNQIRLVKTNVVIQKKSLSVAKALFEVGTRTALDVEQAKAILSSTQALVPDLERSKTQVRNALITLLSLAPSEIDQLLFSPKEVIPVLSSNLKVGIPADLLRRRPDIRQAEWAAIAAAAQAHIAELDRYPRFSLSGSLNLQVAQGVPTLFGGGVGKLFSKDSLGFNIGPSLTIPLFNAGRLKRLQLGQDAAFQQSLEAYKLAIFRGIQDVENALTALAQSSQRYKHLSTSVKAYRQTFHIARVLYQEGEIEFQNIIEAQRRLVAEQQTQLTEQGNISLAQVSLIRALGGGWTPKPIDNLSDDTKAKLKNRKSAWKKYLGSQSTQKLKPSNKE